MHTGSDVTAPRGTHPAPDSTGTYLFPVASASHVASGQGREKSWTSNLHDAPPESLLIRLPIFLHSTTAPNATDTQRISAIATLWRFTDAPFFSLYLRLAPDRSPWRSATTGRSSTLLLLLFRTPPSSSHARRAMRSPMPPPVARSRSFRSPSRGSISWPAGKSPCAPLCPTEADPPAASAA